ncbi:MAG: hypothetical protein M3Q42_12460 [Pseudomonadota bacterium]|nr:hypothetical protein [Pseudomonadota bacterium]
MEQTTSSYAIVRRGPDRRRLWWAAGAMAWALSIGLAWVLSGYIAAPQLPVLSQSLERSEARLQIVQDRLSSLEQQRATLALSDQISRAANSAVQGELAEREEEMAALRTQLAFYERLAGATGKPRGLNVHSAQFVAEDGGTWRYLIVLTQSLDRSQTSLGQLRFSIEGVRDGKLATIDWDTLHQRESAPAQSYSFRYFQQVQGSVMLPEDFTPQRVRVSLRGDHGPLEQAVAWRPSSSNPDI